MYRRYLRGRTGRAIGSNGSPSRTAGQAANSVSSLSERPGFHLLNRSTSSERISSSWFTFTVITSEIDGFVPHTVPEVFAQREGLTR